MCAKRGEPHKTMADFPNTSRLIPSYLTLRFTALQWIRGLWLALGCVLVMAPGVSAGVLDLAWDAPTTNADGTSLSDLRGYRIHIGTSSFNCPGFVVADIPSPTQLCAGNVSFRLTDLLEDGTTYFLRVTAVDLNGNESTCSNEVSGPATTDTSASLIIRAVAGTKIFLGGNYGYLGT